MRTAAIGHLVVLEDLTLVVELGNTVHVLTGDIDVLFIDHQFMGGTMVRAGPVNAVFRNIAQRGGARSPQVIHGYILLVGSLLAGADHGRGPGLSYHIEKTG